MGASLNKHKKKDDERLEEEGKLRARKASQNNKKMNNGSSKPTNANTNAHEKQVFFMRSFIDKGKVHPAEGFTRGGFNIHFTEAVILDDLPFTFGEKQGIVQLLNYSLPTTCLPSDTSVR